MLNTLATDTKEYKGVIKTLTDEKGNLWTMLEMKNRAKHNKNMMQIF